MKDDQLWSVSYSEVKAIYVEVLNCLLKLRSGSGVRIVHRLFEPKATKIDELLEIRGG